MTAISKIERLNTPAVFAAGLISKSLTTFPAVGASPEALRNLDLRLRRPLSTQHRAILAVWNGLDLDVLRIFGVAPVDEFIFDILEWQDGLSEGEGSVAFGSAPSGFLYIERKDGSVWSLDHDGGSSKLLASCIDDFIDNVVFGAQGETYMGKEWLGELQALGLA